jgi:hypothetical protein
MLAVVSFTMLLAVFVATSAFAQERPYSEEYMQHYDGGDRAEYLQEMENNDPWFYVPPVSDASLSTTESNVPVN